MDLQEFRERWKKEVRERERNSQAGGDAEHHNRNPKTSEGTLDKATGDSRNTDTFPNREGHQKSSGANAHSSALQGTSHQSSVSDNETAEKRFQETGSLTINAEHTNRMVGSGFSDNSKQSLVCKCGAPGNSIASGPAHLSEDAGSVCSCRLRLNRGGSSFSGSGSESDVQRGSSNLKAASETPRLSEESQSGTSLRTCRNQQVGSKDQPEYISIAERLLEGRTSPLRDRIEVERSARKKRHAENVAGLSTPRPVHPLQQQPLCKVHKTETLNEINDIPFFDVELPYELALKIFQYLDRRELGRCAQVSKVWKVLAEDEVLWYRLCLKEGHLAGASVSDSPCWKGTLRDCRQMQDTLRSNWKNRVGEVRQLQYELGKVLCDASSSNGLVIAGYTSGDVRLWDTLNWDSSASYLQPSHIAVETVLRPHVTHVGVNGAVAVAAYEDGIVDVWSTEAGREPVHHYQHLQRVQGLALGAEGAIVATASGTQVRVERSTDKGYWETASQCELQKPVEFVQLLPQTDGGLLAVAAAADTVYLLRPGQEHGVLHCVYGHPVTCLDTSSSLAAVGVKSHGWTMNAGNKIQVYCLQTGQAVVDLGNSAGDFTCVNLKDSPPNLLVSGNKDRRVRVFDLRTGKSVVSLYAHHLGVSAVQTDDWKIVSGGEEGLLCLWEMRMGAKLWEMHNRHPVRHARFNTHTLVTANIPDEKTPRGACITDDDLTAHRRHRGVIFMYDFSVDTSASDHVLPICKSSYAESTGYNYNIGLAVPYDKLLAEPGSAL
ncbi:F-box/WD repeat-containing protein 8-like isoform X2 [Acipenser ruthenus]|uniref:F-box/WD repeat-containing protein 8-like isoform X2 n=1 Tax=Acipenser ruthenus TaxID=7906 RepID=UPI002741052E|nr:F-box/WD repeat-containing protein 8-like isoform X2 [Acipenser ruthenus]